MIMRRSPIKYNGKTIGFFYNKISLVDFLIMDEKEKNKLINDLRDSEK